MSLRGRRSVAPLALAILVASSLFAACGETVTQITADDIVELAISTDSLRVPIGRVLPVVAQPLDSTGALLVGQSVGFTSRNPAVASVDENGLVTGVASGTTWVVATIAALGDSTHVTVAPAPLLVLSADAVEIAGTAGGADPADATVEVTNGGAFPLVGLTVDSIVYASPTAGWLAAQLDAASAPATLTLSASTAAVTAADTYEAAVWLSGVDADGSPASVTVTLNLAAGAAASLSLNAGDGQSATVNTEVATPPSVLVLDAFDNPVAGVNVDFAITAGGGSLVDATATTDADGIATVGSWTLGTGAGPNQVTATLGALAPVTFTATGEAGPATQLAIEAGDGQSAIAGAAVSVDPMVVASDEYGNPTAGVDVTFEVTAGGGTATGAVQTTAADGTAKVDSWTLGTTAGANSLRATAAGVATPVTFSATGLSGTAVAVVLVAGDMQTDTVAATLADVYVVRVVDMNDNGVPDVPVSWQVTAGGGSITQLDTTDIDGLATTVRVLGTAPGTNTAQAEVGGLAPVLFSATANVGTPDHVVVTAATDGQSATVNTDVATPPQVRVVDKFGNPIAGHSVTFQVTAGGGTVDPVTAITTGTEGTATAISWTLGTVAGTGNNALQAAATGLTPVTITASGTPDAPATITAVAGDGQPAVSGINVATAPTVLVEDQYGNDVPQATVLFTTTGGSVGSSSPSTGSNGQAFTTWAPNVSGGTMQTDGTFPDTLFAAVQGTGLATSFTGAARYSYPTHVDSIFVNNCATCHSGTPGTSNLSFSGTSSQRHAQLTVNSAPFCDATLTAYRRVSMTGGTTGYDASVLPIIASASTIGACGFGGHPTLSATNHAIVQAWIRNGAPNN